MEPDTTTSVDCQAPAEKVFDLLVDLTSHLDWSGRRNWPGFRLITMDAPEGPAETGTEFTTTGSIVGSLRRWHDRSRVTEAARPTVLAYVTESEARAAWAKPKRMTWSHRYRLTPTPAGCRIDYSISMADAESSLARMTIPGMREMTFRVAIPFFIGHTLRNLARAAEDLANVAPDGSGGGG